MIKFTVYGEQINDHRAKPIICELDENGCWNCISHTTDKKGYPIVTRLGKWWRMCRYIYTFSKGEIPEGMIILHSCDNPKCINPLHLSIGTPKENSEDMVSKGRQAIGEKNGGGVKLDPEKVRQIRNDSRPLRTIAADYGVSHKLIVLVKNHKIWRHVV